MNTLSFKLKDNLNYVWANLFINDQDIGELKIDIDKKDFTISTWNIDKEYRHKGLGKLLMTYTFKYLLKHYGYPNQVIYLWNNANQYVGDWLEKFTPKLDCPLEFLKYSSDDIWSAHKYILNTTQFMKYILVRR